MRKQGVTMCRREWCLFTIAAASGESLSPVQLQKALFLIGDNLHPSEDFYHFAAYDYGPFCREVYEDAELLEAEELIRIMHSSEGGYREYLATPSGVQRAKALRAKINPDHASYVEEVVAWVRSCSFNELISAIYKAYPEMKAKSVFQG